MKHETRGGSTAGHPTRAKLGTGCLYTDIGTGNNVHGPAVRALAVHAGPPAGYTLYPIPIPTRATGLSAVASASASGLHEEQQTTGGGAAAERREEGGGPGRRGGGGGVISS
jgi:hypothetical protein